MRCAGFSSEWHQNWGCMRNGCTTTPPKWHGPYLVRVTQEGPLHRNDDNMRDWNHLSYIITASPFSSREEIINCSLF